MREFARGFRSQQKFISEIPIASFGFIDRFQDHTEVILIIDGIIDIFQDNIRQKPQWMKVCCESRPMKKPAFDLPLARETKSRPTETILCYLYHSIFREKYIIAASIKKSPMLPASRAPSCNCIRVKIKTYKAVRKDPNKAAVFILPKTLRV